MMKIWIMVALVFVFTPKLYADTYADRVLEETLYQSYKVSLTHPSLKMKTGITPFEQSLFVDALWDLTDEGNADVLNQITDNQTIHYDLTQRLRIEILRIKYKKSVGLSPDLLTELMNVLAQPEVDTKLIYTLAAYEEDLLKAGHTDLITLAKTHPAYFDVAQDESKKEEITDDMIGDLFNNAPDTTTYMHGEYVESVKIFMFCRENRLYPCLMVMRNVRGEVVRNADGSIWTHKSLASSARGLPSYSRNGNTPTGVMTIDSVMPVADQQISFGKFRRMILNFIPKSKDEKLLKSLLPPSSINSDWWKAGTTARDIGRNLFRIHGTSKINKDPATPYYPFMRTSGCIAQRENTYDGVTYKDQRDFLDSIMVALDLPAIFENELKVKAILYILEIDDKNAPVEAGDLALKGIE